MAPGDSRGYGPGKALHFSGEVEKFELWSIKFKGYLRLNKLHKTLEEATTGDDEKNAELYATLVQVLDDKSLNLIIRDAADDGRKAFKILQDHYQGTSKPKIISLYCELTSLKKNKEESVTEYMLRAENTATRLKQAEEVVSHGLLIAMILKGLPDSYKPFSTIITQTDSDKMDFQKFKASLRAYEETEVARGDTAQSKDDVFSIKCFKCGKSGHMKKNCGNVSNQNRSQHTKRTYNQRWCTHCKTNTHDTDYCRYLKGNKEKSNIKSAKEDQDYFVFKLSVFEKDVVSSATDENLLLVDCGATTHIVHDPDCFINKDKTFDGSTHIIELADCSRQQGLATLRGDAEVFVKDSEGVIRKIILKRALCIPSYKQNIISVHAMTESNLKVLFSQDKNCIKTENGTIFNMCKRGKLYYLEGDSKCKSDCFSKVITKSLEEWHNTLGHWNSSDLKQLEKCSIGMKISNTNDFSCGTCIEAKMVQQINHNPDSKAKEILELVHTDLSGPMSPESIQGCKYTICFIDDYSGLMTVYFLKKKSDAVLATKKFIADMAPFGKIKKIRSDNGGEYTSKEYEEVMLDNGIRHEYSSPRSPHQNGTAERSWRTMFNLARAMIIESDLPKSLWTYAVRHASFIRNRVYSRQIKMTPFEKFLGKKPDISRVMKFGEKCYSHNIKPSSKLDARANAGVYIGQDTHSPASLVFNPSQNKVLKARSIIHMSGNISKEGRGGQRKRQEEEDEEELWSYPVPETQGDTASATEEEPEEYASVSEGEEENYQETGQNLNSSVICLHPKADGVEVPPNSHLASSSDDSRYPSRNRSLPKYLKENYDVSGNFVDRDIDYFCRISDIPESYEEAIASDNSNDWQLAMQSEYKALCENETFDSVDKPNKKVVGGRWVFCKKNDENGIEIFKARYVAKGFSQVQNIDYGETFSPTAKLTSVRVVLQAAINQDMKLYQLDVKTAYLNAPIDYEIYMKQPKGFQQYDKNGRELVWKLRKSLYGLKQSGRMWNHCLHNFLVENQFTQLISDNCIYVRGEGKEKVILIVWVDDLVIATACSQSANSIKKQLSLKFKMKDFGMLSNFLGIQFILSDTSIKMCQAEYSQKILEKFGMSECHPKSVPCELSVSNIDFDQQSPFLEDPRLYREIVGSLIYLMTCTRPDLCYAVSVLSQHLAAPRMTHFNLAKYVLRYLKGTINYGLVYEKQDMYILGYTDASWASTGNRKSISGYCYMLGDSSALISWKSKKQPIVALSSCEAEYVSITLAMQEGIFLTQLLVELGFYEKSKGVKMFVDNMGAIDLSKNPVHHQRSKHIDLKYHFIRSKVIDGSFVLQYVPSKQNIADIFTKACTKASLSVFKVVKPM